WEPEAVDAGVVGSEWIGERAAVDDDGAEVLMVVLEERLAELDSGRKAGEAHGAVLRRAAADGDQIQKAVVLARDESDVGCARSDGDGGGRGDEGGADRRRAQLLDDVFEHGVPEGPVPAAGGVPGAHDLGDVAPEEGEAACAGDDCL